jgi:prephenate dehydrogenase
VISIFHPSSSIRYPRAVRFQKITIVGVGLLGGSIGLAVKRSRLAREVAGFVRRHASLKDCEKASAVDYATTDLLAAVSNADLVILCTPLSQMRSRVAEMLPALKRGAIVTDVGSVKASVVRELESLVQKSGAHFVGSHPMAGAEKTGVRAARADLFVNAVCVVTPTTRSGMAVVRKVEGFWKLLGARTLRLAPEQHDALVSRSSHLPHIVAAALANLVLDPARPEFQSAVCANGFRDTTRIASGSPEMWRDIILANRENLRVVLDDFVRELQKVQALLRVQRVRALLRAADARKVEAFLATAKHRRDNWCVKGASTSSE